MGRNLPSTTQIVFNQIAELRPFYDALRRSDQLILDKFFEAILQQRAAIGNASGLLPIEIMPWVILLEERKRANHLIHEIYGQMQEMDTRIRHLEELQERE